MAYTTLATYNPIRSSYPYTTMYIHIHCLLSHSSPHSTPLFFLSIPLARVYKFPQGDRYEGSFQKGCMHGQGVYHFSKGDVFEGEFQENKRHGQGMVST